jgi:hypothetical protein
LLGGLDEGFAVGLNQPAHSVAEKENPKIGRKNLSFDNKKYFYAIFALFDFNRSIV